MGGVMTVGYLYKYGYDKVNKIVFLSAVLDGTYMVSDVYQGKINFNPVYAYNFLREGLGLPFIAKILVDILYKAGVIDRLCELLNSFVAEKPSLSLITQ